MFVNSKYSQISPFFFNPWAISCQPWWGRQFENKGSQNNQALLFIEYLIQSLLHHNISAIKHFWQRWWTQIEIKNKMNSPKRKQNSKVWICKACIYYSYSCFHISEQYFKYKYITINVPVFNFYNLQAF